MSGTFISINPTSRDLDPFYAASEFLETGFISEQTLPNGNSKNDYLS